MRENDKSNFLAGHSKVTQRLEECFVELLMLDEVDTCGLTLAAVESLEKTIGSFSLEDQPFDNGTVKLFSVLQWPLNNGYFSTSLFLV